MCELLVMAGSQSSTDPILDARLFKSGDVIIAKPDGWTWGAEELNNALFVLLSVPDLALVEGQALCAEEQGDPMQTPTLQTRIFKLNLSAIPATAAVDGLNRPSRYITVTAADVNGAKVQKSAIPHPLVIG